MIVSYRDFGFFEGWEKFPEFIQSLILSNSCHRVAEIGAGANPAVPQDFAQDHGLSYVAIDADPDELAKADPGQQVVFDLCGMSGQIPGAPYDLIFSRMTAEHFSSVELAYRNILCSLNPGGLTVHSFACLYALPFVVNRLLPDRASDWLLQRVNPRDRHQHEKFRAHYDRCRGPIPSQIEFLKRIGFEILEYRAYFGHSYYKKKFKLLDAVEKFKTQMLVRRPMPHLVSYATVILRRPM